MSNIHVIENALLAHKIAKLRDVSTKPSSFRSLVHDIATIEVIEAMKDFPSVEIDVTTPLETTKQRTIEERKICLVPILRAGLGMSESVSEMIPNAVTGHIGMRRDEVTLLPQEYLVSLPKNIADMHVLLLDPMLATGGSAIDAIRLLKKHGVKSIRFLCIIAAPKGIEAIKKEFPEVPVYIGALDRELNDKSYILPGLGDAGDRIFGTLDD